MKREITLTNGALCAVPQTTEEAGAVVCFEGVVRGLEDGRLLEGLMYEAYRPMADRMLAELADETARRFGLMAMHVEHSVGFVRVGACSFRLRMASAHRREALEATTYFIDRLKQDVPLWKTPIWAAATCQELRT